MISSIDQLGRGIQLNGYPSKIVSVVPSQTELLHFLQLDEEVTGITKFCIHPDQWFRTKTRVGGTKKLNIDRISKLAPELIIANREENTKEDIDNLAEKFPVWVSDVHTLEDAKMMIKEVGRVTNRSSSADQLVDEIDRRFTAIQNLHRQKKRCIYLIWKNPYLCAGGDTFISEMLSMAGFENVCNDLIRYPEISPDYIINSEADVILLSSEPYPFNQADELELKQILPSKMRVLLVDGEMFSWYGSRLLLSPSYFNSLHSSL